MRLTIFLKTFFLLIFLRLPLFGLATEGDVFKRQEPTDSFLLPLNGISSPVQNSVLSQLRFIFKNKSWDYKLSHLPSYHRLKLECRRVGSADDLYFAYIQEMEIDSDFETVQKLLEDVGNYADIYPDYSEIKRVSKSENTWSIRWTKSIPVPLISDTVYLNQYVGLEAEWNQLKQKWVRYQLLESNRLAYSDGFVWISEAVNTGSAGGTDLLAKSKTTSPATKVIYRAVNSWQTTLSFLEKVAASKVKDASVRSIILTDYMLKLKAEQEYKKKQNKDSTEKNETLAKLSAPEMISEEQVEACKNTQLEW